MDKTKLQELDQTAINRLDPEFFVGDASADVGDYCKPLSPAREVDLGPARLVIDEAMDRYSGRKPAESDRWLGPRLHAALRLSRREASRKGVWRFLGIVAFPDYVRWRFKGDKDDPEAPPKLDRFAGPDYKQALARLWWMAEMFRNGPDYGPAVVGLANQDVVNNLFRLDVAHHRPTALGAVAVLGGGDGDALTGRQANALSKAANATAVTVLIDSFAPDDPLDEDARERWIEEAGEHDALAYFDELPEAPEDPPAPEESVKKMTGLLTELLAEAPVRGREKKREPVEEVVTPA